METCGSCRHCERDPMNLDVGACHLNPPQVVIQGPGNVTGFIPPVNPLKSWCAYHTPKVTVADDA